ncbi:MAG: glycosyltransferase family 39 protein [Bacteroidales bacterium]|jgi:4-amino-4-deoxy-L-arabinose transferase-like glycosyltransferase|nr:glycosyltransferase family 39 protein [Bacteroidales bacterium]
MQTYINKKKSAWLHYAIIVGVAILLFFPFLGSVHLFEWDEINFADSSREMIVTDDYNTVRINFEPFWEKPPIFILMQVASMKLFGINEFAARFPNAICGILTLLFLFCIGRRLYNEKFGAIWTLSYAGSVLPFFYFKSGIIDPWFNLFIFAGIYYSIRFLDACKDKNISKSHFYLICSASAIGVGILTKGPVALLIWGLTAFIYAVYRKFQLPIRWYHVPEFLLVLFIVGGSWFLGQIFVGNKDVVVDFINYQIRLFQTQDAGHGGFPLYHFVILLFGVFPASLFSLAAYKKTSDDTVIQKDVKTWMIILLWVVLIVFSIVKTKIIHYSSLCYFPLTFLGAYVLYNYCYRNIPLKKWIHVLVMIFAAILFTIVAVMTNIFRFKDYIIENKLFNDPFALANLQADAGWTGFEVLIALIPLLLMGFATYYYRKSQALRYTLTVFVGTCLFTFLTMTVIVKRVEAYSQRAAIEFFKSLEGKDCYVITLGYKSYAHYFYAETQRSMKPALQYLENNETPDAPLFVSTKITRKERVMNQYPQLEILYEKNGFVFLKMKTE